MVVFLDTFISFIKSIFGLLFNNLTFIFNGSVISYGSVVVALLLTCFVLTAFWKGTKK